jgi:hypothetical protein
MDYRKWAIAALAVASLGFFMSSCSVQEQREKTEMEEAEKRVTRERPPIGDWKTEVLQGRDKP